MQALPQPNVKSRRIGLWITLAVALAYCVWLGAHWLPLDWSDKEMSASASRVWDIQREWSAHGHISWWTPNFMSGSSYGLNHARGFYLIPWMLFSTYADLITAGRLTALANNAINSTNLPATSKPVNREKNIQGSK